MKRKESAVAVAARPAPQCGTDPLVEFADEARCAKVAGTLSLLANPKRLMLLCLLSERDRSVEELVACSGGSVSAMSQQLKLLTISGCLGRRRDGKNVIYSLTDDRILQILHLLKDLYS